MLGPQAGEVATFEKKTSVYQTCGYWVRGRCKYGDKCKFAHYEIEKSATETGLTNAALSDYFRPIKVLYMAK